MPGFAQSAAARKRMDSIDNAAKMRGYRNSKHYKDSVAKARKNKASAIKNAREAHLDSTKAAKEKITDSLASIREVKKDSLTAIQKERADKVKSKKKYKESKRYSDSVAIVKRERSDAMKRKQKIYKDSVASERQREQNLTKGVRKHEMDSIKAVRTKFNDSLKIVRKKRTDSMAKMKLAKNKQLNVKDKQSEAKKKLALELKFKSKREAFTNKSMLKKRWSPLRKLTQNSFTHYNYYYNANRKLEEANANMLRGGVKENYDSLIKIFPFDPDRDSSMLAADMDSIIHKVSIGIQIHDPRVKWGNDMLLLMGQAYYYKGNYKNAAATFKYIISNDEENKKAEGGHQKGPTSIVEEENKGGFNLFKHKSVHNDAIIWLARVYTQMKMVENGQAVLSLLSTDPHLPEDLVGQVAIGRAFGYMSEQNYSAASEQLTVAINDDYLPDWLRMRAAFLNAQLMQRDGKYKESVASYEIALDYFPKIDMDFYARKNIAFNTLLAGGNVGDGIKPLKKVLNDGKYTSYYDQVYFVLGQMSAKAGKTNDAIDYLTKSAITPKATKKQKAISYAALGDVYYGRGSYNDAKNAYDSSAKYAAGSSIKDASVIAAAQRSKGLVEISQPTAIIHDQDSLRDLAELSKKEQLSVVKRYIRSLEQKQADSIKNAKDAGESGTAITDAASETGETSTFYFANPTLMQTGSNEFKRKWGNRPLTDNWRRASGVAFTGASGTNQSGLEETPTTGDDKVALAANGLPTEESLLAKIPNTAEQKEQSIKMETRAYIMLAKAYLKQLDDHVQALSTLDTLDSRFPDHNQKEEDIYLRYQIAIRTGNLEKAQAYATEFLAKFPKSPYADLLKPRADNDKLASANGGKQVAQYFDETYELILKHQYAEALSNISVAKKEYPANPAFKKRFQVAEAMSYAGQGNYNMADTILAGFLAANPADSLTGWAKDVSSYIADVRKNGIPSWYNDTAGIAAMKAGIKVSPVKKAEDAKKAAAPVVPPPPKRPADVPVAYSYKPTEQHFTMLVFNSLDSRMGKFKEAVEKLNATMSINNPMLIDLYRNNEIVVTVQQFAGEQAARDYMDSVNTNELLKDYKPEEFKFFVISALNYKKLFWEKDLELYTNYYSTYYKKP